MQLLYTLKTNNIFIHFFFYFISKISFSFLKNNFVQKFILRVQCEYMILLFVQLSSSLKNKVLKAVLFWPKWSEFFVLTARTMQVNPYFVSSPIPA